MKVRLLVWIALLAVPVWGQGYRTPHAPLLGAAWYPEQWPEAQWETDLQLMQDAHMNVVRIGEFAWSSIEPSEGKYELQWMERAIALAAKHHLAVVIGTPTDAPPAWMTAKYPDTLGMNADGQWREHGNRRQFNYASPRYRAMCAAVVEQMARRFGGDARVMGWQIGNEYTDESFDPATKILFQAFLKNKFGTLEKLNKEWATAYWSETYTAWNQIPMESVEGNPGLLLEHKHFVTATWRSFQKVQVDVLRRYAKGQFITTNIGGLGWSDNWDHSAMTEDLDLASWDDYVGQGHLQVARNAMLNDFVRGWKRQNFWVMETQPGSVNWAPVNNALAPGETRALAWQAIGHGADAILYWQWRDALNGQEQYHGAIAGPDGKALPIYAEIAQLGKDLNAARSVLEGTSPHAEVAILHTYDSRWAIDFQIHTKNYDQQQILLRFYEPLSAYGHTVDVIDPQRGDLSRYKLLVAPSLNVISEALAAKLLAYVRGGGHLLLGPRSGMKDEFNSLHPQRQPGPLATALGARVEQYYALEEKPDAAVRLIPEGSLAQAGMGFYSPMPEGSASIWAEALGVLPVSDSAGHVDLQYAQPGGWLDGQPAMVTHSLEAGSISYLGTIPSAELMREILMRAEGSAMALSGTMDVPVDVEVCTRSDAKGKKTFIFIHHGAGTARVRIPGTFRSVLPGLTLHESTFPTDIPGTAFELPAEGVAVLMRVRREDGR